MAKKTDIRKLTEVFEDVLDQGRSKQQSAEGTSAQDFIYAPAEEVRQGRTSWLFDVKFQNKWYEGYQSSWGSLDGGPNKSTVLLEADDKKWYKLWYLDSEVKKR